jgi:N-acetylglutamate synthase-like GNAT family acetyltransferase
MGLLWVSEGAPRWDADKVGIIGEAPAGMFDSRYRALAPGAMLPGDWWRVEADGKTVGYGWLDVCWGDAEILLAVDPTARAHGVGSFILEQLHKEAARRGLNYLTNVVRPTHPEAAAVTQWLQKRGFKASDDGRLFCAVVRRSA